MVANKYHELWVQVDLDCLDLWSHFCFDQQASGIETMDEAIEHEVLRCFFENSTESALQKLPDLFFESFGVDSNKVQILKIQEEEIQNWNENWKEYFEPVPIGQTFMVTPPWKQEGLPEDRNLILIEPGEGFGTGYHPSTFLALELLEEYVQGLPSPPSGMLDIGAGSGILCFAAKHLGIPKMMAVDIDFAAIENLKHNARLNECENQVNTFVGDVHKIQECYPLVIANMLLFELQIVQETIQQHLRKGSTVICSGILHEQREEFIATVAQGHSEWVQQWKVHESWNGVILSLP